MKNLFIFLFTFFMSYAATAQSVSPMYRDVKLPTQKVLEVQSFSNLEAASTNNIKSAFAGLTTGVAVSLTSFLEDPDQARNLVITPAGTAADMGSCVLTVSGTDFNNHSISETFSFTANTTTAAIGVKAFKTVSSVAFPADCEDSPYGVTWSIGQGEKIGLKRCMDSADFFEKSSTDGVTDGSLPTIAADADEVSKNTIDLPGTMNGTSDFRAFFMQNYACF